MNDWEIVFSRIMEHKVFLEFFVENHDPTNTILVRFDIVAPPGGIGGKM